MNTPYLSDAPLEDLVFRVREGDQDAWAELTARFTSMVRRTAWQKLQNESLVDDLAQEVFLQVFRSIHQLRDPLALPAWLRSITHHLAINAIVRNKPLLPMSHADMVSSGYRGNEDLPIDRMIKIENQTYLRRTIARLKKIDQEAIDAFYFEEQSLQEMADRFDLPLGTIKRRLFTARHRLREKLQGTFVS